MRTSEPTAEENKAFATCCKRLEGIGRRLGLRTDGRHRGLGDADLEMSGLSVDPGTIIAASRALAVLVALLCIALSSILVIVVGINLVVPLAFVSVIAPYLAKEALRSYPKSVAGKRAAEVLRSSNEGINLMIMSLRHEPSLPKAIWFASKRDCAFSRELRSCIWGVIMGKYSSFEESIHSLGTKWSGFAHELKTSMNALVTASCEATEDGKRRALDRANQAMIQGAKRRIEEYALSLSAPSMILFGLGILLPLMVGSFLPMLSWNMLSMGDFSGGQSSTTQDSETVRTVFLMNVLFPAIAVTVVMGAVSRHPLETRRTVCPDSKSPGAMQPLLAVTCSVVLILLSSAILDGLAAALAMLMSGSVPTSLWLIVRGRRTGDPTASRQSNDPEDALFRTGGYMVEGENFESSFWKAARRLEGDSGALVRQIHLQSDLELLDSDDDGSTSKNLSSDNALRGLRIVKEAAKKDERASGILAMDLSAYLRDLRDLETGLRNRLRPTIAMMKMTAHALAPIVLGVTYAIYLSLGSIVEGVGSVDPGHFFLVLGVFLAEINAIVVYFVWGIEGRRRGGDLMYSLGICILGSGLVYSATAVMIS